MFIMKTCFIICAALSIFCSRGVVSSQSRIETLKEQAYDALQLQLGILRWQAYWNRERYPEYVAGQIVDIPIFSNVLGDAIGFCARFAGWCELYSDRGRGLESVGSFRFDARCDETCQGVEFTDLYRRIPKFSPPESNTKAKSEPQIKDQFFDTTRFAGRDYDINAPTPPMQVQFSIEWTLPSLGIESLRKDELPPEAEQLLEWARKDAKSIFRPECGTSVTVSVPFNVPPRDSIYVYFGLAPRCDDYAVLVGYDPEQGWLRHVDFFAPSDVLPLKKLIEANLFKRLVVTP